MKIRDSFIEGNDKRGIPRKSGIMASQGYSSQIFAILLLLSAIALYGFTLSLANAAPAPISCFITPANDSVIEGSSITLTGNVAGGQGKKSYTWNTGGVPLNPTSSTVNVTYNNAGMIDISLIVTDKNGPSDPCTATVVVSNPGPGPGPGPSPTASANGPYTGTIMAAVNFSSAGSMASDTATITSYSWDFGDGSSTSSDADPSHTYAAVGDYDVELTITDSNGGVDTATTSSNVLDIPTVSVNSTSQNGNTDLLLAPVLQHSLAGNITHRIFGANDLGMHCGDFDTRISSILPPFNVLHAQVILRGNEPDILTPDDGVNVVYSAASNPDDPILSGVNSAGSGDVLSSVANNATVFKTNFWDIVAGGETTALSAYRPFYPPGILDAFAPVPDQGLPMPNVERLYLGDGILTAEQQLMPGILASYLNNELQRFTLFTVDQPFFIDPAFQFGYVSEGVDWYEAAGVPLTAFDDYGRENPWPLYRFQAKDNITGAVLASSDVVLPISGEANCGFCHNAPVDGGNGAATQVLEENGISVATVLDDPEFDKSVPLAVSKEYAADLNLVRLHDLKHSTDLENNTPVVCQSCHYTPALDLAQVGPRGAQNDTAPGDPSNGRDQVVNKSMSNVMHSHHGTLDTSSRSPGDEGYDGTDLMFPMMPLADKNDMGVVVNDDARRIVLQETCYQCHPGQRTDCLRGAMANGGMLCQDCHGNMEQVGDDFSRNVAASPPSAVGAFELGGDFYTNPDQPRVPWANEPGCGSCHTGDALDNLAGTANTVVNNVDANMNDDGIRLFQAYLNDDSKATPIVPSNKRFAENVIEENNLAVSGPDDPRIGNPMLYRVSTGHEGVFCEACHGATHGIWPNKNPNANDNVTAMQLQGHTGTITECTTCHTGSFKIDDFKNSVITGDMKGPHGMHPVNDPMWKKHKEVFELNKDSCRTCHGENGEGTVLSTTAAIRVMECKNTDGNFPECADGDKFATVDRNTPIACDNCHAMEN